MKTFPVGLTLVFCYLLSVETKAETYSVSSSDKTFFQQMRKAVLEDNVEWFSGALIGYPFTVKLNRGQIKLKDKEDLKAHASTIFTAKLKDIVRNQSPDSLFKNWRGLMVGQGEIWFTEIAQTNKNEVIMVYRIIAVNVPQDRSKEAVSDQKKSSSTK